MKLDIIYCHQCGSTHAPGQHAVRRGPKPPADDDWETGAPTRKPKAVAPEKPARVDQRKLPRKPPEPVKAEKKPIPSRKKAPKPVTKPTPEETKAVTKLPKEERRKRADTAVKSVSARPPKVTDKTPARKQTDEYRAKMKLLMRQKRAAAQEGITLDDYRAKYGVTFDPKAETKE